MKSARKIDISYNILISLDKIDHQVYSYCFLQEFDRARGVSGLNTAARGTRQEGRGWPDLSGDRDVDKKL